MEGYKKGKSTLGALHLTPLSLLVSPQEDLNMRRKILNLCYVTLHCHLLKSMRLDQLLYNWLLRILLWRQGEICLQLSPKIIFLHIIDIRHLRVFLLRLIPLVDADRDLVPNQNPALSSKCILCPEGFNRLAVARDCCDLKPFIRAQLFLRASSLYRSSARSGGLDKRRKARVIN